MIEQNVIHNLRIMISKGTDGFERWVKDNPNTTTEILKAHYQLFLTEIIQNRIFEYEDVYEEI